MILESDLTLVPLVCASSNVPPTGAIGFSPFDCVTGLFLAIAVVVGFSQLSLSSIASSGQCLHTYYCPCSQKSSRPESNLRRHQIEVDIKVVPTLDL